jgi:repressor LexA
MRAAGEEMRERIRQAIADLTARNNRPPTNREIGERLGGSGKPLSTGHIDYHLRIMREQGLITHDPKKSRGIMLTEAAGSAERAGQALGITPFRVRVQGNIAAGRPIEAVTDPDDFVELAAPGVGGEGLYALRVRGKSMIEDLIDDNDVVIVRPQESVDNGDTVVALLLNGASEVGEVTLKRYYRERDRIRLQPANSTMEPIYVREQDLRIQGKVVAVIRQVG